MINLNEQFSLDSVILGFLKINYYKHLSILWIADKLVQTYLY